MIKCIFCENDFGTLDHLKTHSELCPKHPAVAEVERLRNAKDASEAHANKWMDKLSADIKRLKGLVRDAFMEGLDAGHNTTIDVSAEHLWADSEARAELGDD